MASNAAPIAALTGTRQKGYLLTLEAPDVTLDIVHGLGFQPAHLAMRPLDLPGLAEPGIVVPKAGALTTTVTCTRGSGVGNATYEVIVGHEFGLKF
jgi:hypothetical protein